MKIALVDPRISNSEHLNLSKLNCKVIKCPINNTLYKAVCGHPDMSLHVISNDTLILEKDIDVDFINLLKNFNLNCILSDNSLKSNYPYDISLNALNLKNYFIHNLKFTDKKLLSFVTKKNLIHVKQGYTKCSTAILNDNAIITSDKSIHKALLNTDIDVLLLPPGDINLPGLDYGFIGGTCGLFDKNTLVFYGSLDNYKYKNEVLNFLCKYKITPIYLSEGKLTDRGSIFFLDI